MLQLKCTLLVESVARIAAVVISDVVIFITRSPKQGAGVYDRQWRHSFCFQTRETKVKVNSTESQAVICANKEWMSAQELHTARSVHTWQDPVRVRLLSPTRTWLTTEAVCPPAAGFCWQLRFCPDCHFAHSLTHLADVLWALRFCRSSAGFSGSDKDPSSTRWHGPRGEWCLTRRRLNTVMTGESSAASSSRLPLHQIHPSATAPPAGRTDHHTFRCSSCSVQWLYSCIDTGSTFSFWWNISIHFFQSNILFLHVSTA